MRGDISRFTQTNVKLSKSTISALKRLAKANKLNYSYVCERILVEGLAKIKQEGYTLFPPASLQAAADIENSRKRQQKPI